VGPEHIHALNFRPASCQAEATIADPNFSGHVANRADSGWVSSAMIEIVADLPQQPKVDDESPLGHHHN
jgi:hypothetical protein